MCLKFKYFLHIKRTLMQNPYLDSYIFMFVGENVGICVNEKNWNILSYIS